MIPRIEGPAGTDPPRPVPDSYWLLPGRLLVGEYPGSQSRAEAMERLRRFLQSGVTCFVDLTEPRELPSYEALLPFATPDGRRVEYLREPIPDHGVPKGREVMERVLAVIDDSLAAGHVVYLHCRAGIGRSATVAGCWLAQRGGVAEAAIEELQRCWQQSARSASWSQVPETDEQMAYVRDWLASPVVATRVRSAPGLGPVERARGALLGLAAGDAVGSARAAGLEAAPWSQHTALALCTAESLLAHGRLDARDQVERFHRWQRDGYLAADGAPGRATPDVARALANYLWRGQPMAGSHDPRDRSTAALPRVVATAIFAQSDPEVAIQLAAESARATHQSPVVLDACRYFAALLSGLLRGEDPARVLHGLYEPAAGLWSRHPLKPEVASMAKAAEPPQAESSARRPSAPDVVAALARARAAVAVSGDFETAITRACDAAAEPALEAAVAGALFGAIAGPQAIPRALAAATARADIVEALADRLVRASAGSTS